MSQANDVREVLLSLKVRASEVRALSLVDPDGLVLVSTLGAGELDDTVGAFAGQMAGLLSRAQRDLDVGPLIMTHLSGRHRQVFLTSVGPEMTLVAMVDPHANPSTISMHLLALARDLPDRLDGSWETPRTE